MVCVGLCLHGALSGLSLSHWPVAIGLRSVLCFRVSPEINQSKSSQLVRVLLTCYFYGFLNDVYFLNGKCGSISYSVVSNSL